MRPRPRLVRLGYLLAYGTMGLASLGVAASADAIGVSAWVLIPAMVHAGAVGLTSIHRSRRLATLGPAWTWLFATAAVALFPSAADESFAHGFLLFLFGTLFAVVCATAAVCSHISMRTRPRGRGRCVGCGYELKGIAVCPECGGAA